MKYLQAKSQSKPFREPAQGPKRESGVRSPDNGIWHARRLSHFVQRAQGFLLSVIDSAIPTAEPPLHRRRACENAQFRDEASCW